MPEPKPKEAVQDRQLDTLMQAAPALETLTKLEAWVKVICMQL